MPASALDLRVQGEFDSPITRVWAAWTQPEEIRAWWGPKGFTCSRAEVDGQSGGRIDVSMRAPDEWGGFEQHSTWRITSWHPPSLLRYDFVFTDARGNPVKPVDVGAPDGVPDRGEHEVRLSSLPGDRTQLVMIERGYLTEEARDLSRMGLEQCLDKMAALVEHE